MPTSITLAPEIEARLDILAANTGRARSQFLQEIIENGLEDVEDYYLATETLSRIRSGKEGVVSEAQLRKNLGLEN